MELSRHQCGALTLVQVRLKDRRTRAARDERFLFQHHVEEALYGSCTGALYRLLGRCSLSQAPLLLKASSVGEGLVTRAEYDFLIQTFQEGLPWESQGRVRSCTLLAANHVPALCLKLGRSERTTALLRALAQPLPRRWELEAEQEQHAANAEVDLLLEDELAEEEELEAPLHAELLHTAVPYEVTEAEQEAVKVYKLERVPRALEAQLDAYRDWRLQPLNYARTGGAVVDITQANDRATALRFLAFCKMEKGLEPSLAVFGSAALADLVQAWLQHAVERGLMWSTLSQYVNSLLCVAGYVWDSMEVEQAAREASPQPPDALLNLRSQCEQQSKVQQLYAKKPANWLDWDKAQAARVKCATAWAKAGALPHDKKLALLKEYLVILFHTVMCARARTSRLPLEPSDFSDVRFSRPPCLAGRPTASASCASCDGTPHSSVTRPAPTGWT